MHRAQELLEKYCSALPSLTIIDRGASFEIKWKDSFGALVHKDSDQREAIVCWEANPYNPREARVEWPLLATWLLKNVR